MARRPLPLAKLSRPRQAGVLARPRLFARIEAACKAKTLWIAGPPGSGKTTLVASYLDARGLPGIWYHADGADSDPATFFYFLGRAAGGKLPLLKPEYQQDLPRFARRFFRQLFEGIEQGWTLVVDDYHELSAASALHALLRHAVSELPEGANLIVLSRGEPPRELAPISVARQLQRIDWRELAFDLEETRAFVELRGAPDAAPALHQRAGGWAAGLVLLTAERSRGLAPPDFAAEAMETLFAYFAAEIFDKADAALREFLLLTAFLPRLTEASAAAVSGNPRAGRLLAELYRAQLFIDRREEDGAVYRYHDLFRDFLLQRAAEAYPVEKVVAIRRQAARVLELAGQVDDAVPMYIAAGDAPAAASLIRACAQSLIAQGRGQTLRDWIGALPGAQADAQPWLDYFHGLSLVPTDPEQAVSSLERAHGAFRARGDVAGQLLAAAASINALMLEFSRLPLLERWIDAVEGHVPHEAERLGAQDQLYFYSSLFVALWQRRPRHPLLPLCLDRTLLFIDSEIDADLRVTAGTHLVQYSNLAADRALRERVVARIAPLLRGARVSALNRATWLARLAFVLSLDRERDRHAALPLAAEAQCLAAEHGFRATVGFGCFAQFLVEMRRADLAAAERSLARWPAPVSASPHEVSVWHIARTHWASARGDFAAALDHARSVAAAVDAGAPAFGSMVGYSLHAVLLARVGRHEEARQQYAVLRERFAATGLARLAWYVLAVRACLAVLADDADETRAALRELLATARANRNDAPLRLFPFIPGMDVRLVEAALRAGIEVEYLQDYVRRRGLVAESNDVPHWPWPLRIRTLGRFDIDCGGRPLVRGRKAQRKPLELLAALIARGARAVPVAALAADLWPDAEGDAAADSFAAALHRLRKLVGGAEAIVLRDGRLSLDPRLCWTDVWAFERLCSDGKAAAMDLYAGHFLAGEPERPWMLEARGRLRGRFLRLALAVGARLERDGDDAAAQRVYERALEVDNLAEAVYRNLMRCLMRRGAHAQAMQTYRRCRELLGIALGVAPEPDTQALYQALRAGGGESVRHP